MRQRVLSVLAAALLAAPALLFGQAGDAGKVLTDLRAALGGADRLADVKTLTAAGTIRRVTPRGINEIPVELAVALPDKYVARTTVVSQGAMSVFRSVGFNGDGAINVVDAPPDLSGAGGLRDGVSSDRLRAAAQTQTAEERAAADRRIVLNAKREFTRLTLGLLASSYAAFPLQFTYAGLAESPDGSAHVLGVTGPEGLEARLFVDARTNRPLMLVWSERGPGEAAAMVEHRLFYSDFRKTGDLTLPHTFQRTADGRVTEETTYTEIRLNPAIDSKKFEISR